jgi:hypothetical protein
MGWIPGRPVSRIVLVGCGATRMPAIGRLVTQQLTSVVPEKKIKLVGRHQLGESDNAVVEPKSSGHPQAMAVQDGKDTYKDNEDDEDDDDRKYPYC